jgi:hypothetical protein
MNRRELRCGKTILAIGQENSLADKREKKDTCLHCDIDLQITCPYWAKYIGDPVLVTEKLILLYDYAYYVKCNPLISDFEYDKFVLWYPCVGSKSDRDQDYPQYIKDEYDRRIKDANK